MGDWDVERKINLPVQLRDGEVTYLGGLPLPPIKEGAIADLILPASALLESDITRLLLETAEVQLLPKGEVLLAGVKTRGIPEILREQAQKAPEKAELDPIAPADLGWVRIDLLQDLILRVGGGVHSELLDCACRIPALPDKEVRSVNHAYTLISEVFEPNRRSHTGSAFQKVYYPEQDLAWVSLDRLRQRQDVLIEARIRFELLLDAFGIRGYRQRRANQHPSLLSEEVIGRYEVERALGTYAEDLPEAHRWCCNQIRGLGLPPLTAERGPFLAWVLKQAPWLSDFTEVKPVPEVIIAISQIIWITDHGLWNHDLDTPGLRPLLRYSVAVLDFIWRQRSAQLIPKDPGRLGPA